MSRLTYTSRIFFQVLLNMLELLLMHATIFSILGQPWLASIQSLWRGRPETATGGSLLPRAALLLLPRAKRWYALAAAAPLLLPRVCRRWESLAATTLLLLPRTRGRLHRMTLWRCGWWLLLLILRHAWRRLRHPTIPPRASWDTMMNAPTSKRWAHMNWF
jgi:hypothetical protein